jgi:hypothetical protein
MSQRTALLVATTLTVFLLVVMGGVALAVFQKTAFNVQGLQTSLQPQAIVQDAQPATPSQTNAPAVQAQLDQREAQYRDLVQQANQKLEQAYKQQQDLTKQVQVAEAQKAKEQAAAKAPTNAQPKYPFTANQATDVALQAVPGAVLLHAPELVNFKNDPAYEVTLDRGVVYVSAVTGKILYNSADVITVRNSGGGSGGAKPSVSAPPAPSKSEHEEDHKEDHKSEDHKSEDHKSEDHEGKGGD